MMILSEILNDLQYGYTEMESLLWVGIVVVVCAMIGIRRVQVCQIRGNVIWDAFRIQSRESKSGDSREHRGKGPEALHCGSELDGSTGPDR
jgi:hypothetical protein